MILCKESDFILARLAKMMVKKIGIPATGLWQRNLACEKRYAE